MLTLLCEVQAQLHSSSCFSSDEVGCCGSIHRALWTSGTLAESQTPRSDPPELAEGLLEGRTNACTILLCVFCAQDRGQDEL